MDKELKDKWVAALRSGEFTQTTGTLERLEEHTTSFGKKLQPGFCCLGVLCKVAELPRRLNAAGDCALYMDMDRGISHRYNDESSGDLPIGFAHSQDLTSDGRLRKPVVVRKERDDEMVDCIYDSLVALNDDAGFTFEQIAKVIEEQL